MINPYLKIVASLLHGGKHSVDKLEHMLWSNNENTMYHGQLPILHCTVIGLTCERLVALGLPS